MGARPLFGLNVVGWNRNELPLDLLVEVLSGAADVAQEGGWLILGGHTVDDPEPKVGVAVIGEAHPDRLLTNEGLRPGDALVLTKPLGVGVAVTALKRGEAAGPVLQAAVDAMLRTNRRASEAALEAHASAATDVTGFGLLGHLRTMVVASGVDVTLDVAAIPLLPGIGGLVQAGFVPGGTGRNLEWVRDRLDAGAAEDWLLDVLADPQTSGGMLFGAEPTAALGAVASLRGSGHDAAVIGHAGKGHGVIRLC